jgi:hypothetical protein
MSPLTTPVQAIGTFRASQQTSSRAIMESHLKCEKSKERQTQKLIIFLGMLGNRLIELLYL